MSAERLREAARMMRERAQAATPGPWVPNGTRVDQSMVKAVADCYDEPRASRADAEHIASWHPVVALAVADSWTALADELDTIPEPAWTTADHESIAAAETYLGGAS